MRLIRQLIFPISLLFFFIALHAHGQETQHTKTFYFLNGFHYLFPDYPQNLERRVGILRRSPGLTRIPVSADVFGYYKPSGSKLIGGVFRFSADQYSANGNSLRIEYYQLSLSALYFVMRPLARERLFVRGDIGPAVMRLSTSDKGTEILHAGWSVAAGFGYALKIKEFSVMPAFQYSILFLKKSTHRQNQIGIDLLY